LLLRATNHPGDLAPEEAAVLALLEKRLARTLEDDLRASLSAVA
jgi:hypothetical protein